MITLSEKLDSKLRSAIALRVHGSSNLSLDRFQDARKAYSQCRVVASDCDLSRSVIEYGENPMVSSTIMLAQVISYEGRLEEGWKLVKQAKTFARASAEPISIVQAAAARSIIALLRKVYAACLEAAEEETRFSEEHGFVHWHAHSDVMIGVARTYLDPADNQIALAIAGIERWRGTGAQLYMPTFCSYLAECTLSVGQLDIAERASEDGLQYVEANQERLVLAELQRLSAVIAQRRGNLDLALERINTGIAIAESQTAWLFNLKSQTNCAEILQVLGRGAQGSADLRRALDRITEYTEGPDFKRAQKVLAELG